MFDYLLEMEEKLAKDGEQLVNELDKEVREEKRIAIRKEKERKI